MFVLSKVTLRKTKCLTLCPTLFRTVQFCRSRRNKILKAQGALSQTKRPTIPPCSAPRSWSVPSKPRHPQNQISVGNIPKPLRRPGGKTPNTPQAVPSRTRPSHPDQREASCSASKLSITNLRPPRKKTPPAPQPGTARLLGDLSRRLRCCAWWLGLFC